VIKSLFLLTALTLLHLSQDVRVATFSTGIPDTKSYESLAFWIKDNQRAYIRYARGTEADDIELNWLGSDSVDGHRRLKAGFPGSGAPGSASRTLFIAPAGDSLLVIDHNNDQHLMKKFHWENESSSGDSAGSCSICTPNVKEAMDLVRRYFLK
jgi:hypothetical protein